MRLLFSIVLLFSTTAFLSAQAPDSLKNWIQYSEQIFSIRYPTTHWLTTEELNARFCIATKATENKPYDRDLIKVFVMDTAFQLQKPQKSNDKGFRDNLYLAVNTYQSNTDLGVYAQQALDQLKTTLKNVKITQSGRKKSDNLAYQEVVSEGILGTHSVKMKQWHFVKGKKAYSLTFVARINKFDESNDVVNEVFKSFKLK